MKSTFHILIVDDEPHIRSGLARGLMPNADKIETAASVNEALDKFDGDDFQLVIADVRMPGDRDGLDLISLVKQRSPCTSTIVITADDSTEAEAIRRGAIDFVSKPVDLERIRQPVARAAEHYRLQGENRELKEKLADAGDVSGLVGNSLPFERLLMRIRQVGLTDATVMIQGESGTGKQRIAEAIHDQSQRSTGPFVAVNLGALPHSLLENELLLHERGSFTGASRRRSTSMEKAIGGTLFLDEITELPAKCQADLLRVLESQNSPRAKGGVALHSDARIVSATNRDLSQMLAEGTFREDLYYRLNIVPVHVPPLRSRRADIPLLVDCFLDHFCNRHGRPLKSVAPEAMHRLVHAYWPGNVRQLRNVIERLVVISTRDTIEAHDLPAEQISRNATSNRPVRTLAEITETAEKAGVEIALAANAHHRELTAKSLGISVRTLHYKMNKYNLHK